MSLDSIKNFFKVERKSPELDINEGDRANFCIISRQLILSELDPTDWRTSWGLSRDTGLNQGLIEAIMKRYEGKYFDTILDESDEGIFYGCRLTDEGVTAYNNLTKAFRNLN